MLTKSKSVQGLDGSSSIASVQNIVEGDHGWLIRGVGRDMLLTWLRCLTW